ncbi:Calcium/calmodulin-dependent protein kinase kinase 1 [Clydaea vesicula]|uniref:Calcium/calmodulin-dependent protein kinase kinase 1 n=1 Tax=Clydaea vesicula TaxID=447962 RepID=A0AAD5U5J2_9FUNG|nr:Calcium/calmodulin-dependent protein kinase kinase 1 [Clydaea vesicula]
MEVIFMGGNNKFQSLVRPKAEKVDSGDDKRQRTKSDTLNSQIHKAKTNHQNTFHNDTKKAFALKIKSLFSNPLVKNKAGCSPPKSNDDTLSDLQQSSIKATRLLEDNFVSYPKSFSTLSRSKNKVKDARDAHLSPTLKPHLESIQTNAFTESVDFDEEPVTFDLSLDDLHKIKTTPNPIHIFLAGLVPIARQPTDQKNFENFQHCYFRGPLPETTLGNKKKFGMSLPAINTLIALQPNPFLQESDLYNCAFDDSFVPDKKRSSWGFSVMNKIQSHQKKLSKSSFEDESNSSCSSMPSNQTIVQSSPINIQLKKLKSNTIPRKLNLNKVFDTEELFNFEELTFSNTNPQIHNQNRKLRSKSEQKRKIKTEVIETNNIYQKTELRHMVYSTGAAEHVHGRVNQYEILRDIGAGAFGKVALCRDSTSGRFYASKIMSKQRLKKKFRWSNLPNKSGCGGIGKPAVSFDNSSAIKREIAIFKKMSHPNINALVEVLDDPDEDNLYMIFELCEYGQIMKIRIGEYVQGYSEDLARLMIRDVILGLEYLHSKKIIHRDLKPENLLLNAQGVVQIADFGISFMVEEEGDTILDDKNASPLFCPPEACQTDTKNYKGEAFDIWSLGVTLYCLLHGRCPFEDTNHLELCLRICNDEVVLSPKISDLAKDLILKMLIKNPEQRITLPEIKAHPWIELAGKKMLDTARNIQGNFQEENIEITEEEVENAFTKKNKSSSALSLEKTSFVSKNNSSDDANSITSTSSFSLSRFLSNKFPKQENISPTSNPSRSGSINGLVGPNLNIIDFTHSDSDDECNVVFRRKNFPIIGIQSRNTSLKEI